MTPNIQATQPTNLSTTEPTYWPTDKNKVPDLVDFCITKGISKELQTVLGFDG
jgi:hypothetical protein